MNTTITHEAYGHTYLVDLDGETASIYCDGVWAGNGIWRGPESGIEDCFAILVTKDDLGIDEDDSGRCQDASERVYAALDNALAQAVSE